jgi:hypothetical protein
MWITGTVAGQSKKNISFTISVYLINEPGGVTVEREFIEPLNRPGFAFGVID